MSIQPKVNINLEEINTKKQRLETIKAELKREFIGIDYIIEELVDYIQIWYLMPDILTRPIIVNLWGMTGVGKTDLIRKLVSKLEYQDRFVEVELSNGESTWNSNVSSILETNGVNDAKPAIVLFDEIQRFYTIDSEGKPLLNTRFQDFWELLSDGKLAKRDAKESIDDYLQRYLYAAMQRQKRKQKLKDAPPMPPDAMNPMGGNYDEEEATVGVWEAQSLKKIFDLKESVSEIAEMREEDVLMMMQQTREKKKVYEPINHAKTLIIISGNLDEAYSMANETGETDIEADIFRAYTEKITIVDIKNALSRKFKPEQVARFGNIHLIYKSLRKGDFENLIKEEIHKIVKKNKEHFGVDIEISENLNQLIYQNGVFPVQGVRPVFSSITDIVEANLSKLLFEAFMGNLMHIAMDYDFDRKKIIAQLAGKKTVELDYVGKIDQIRQDNSPDMVANIAVHESGHAIAYGILLGLAPLQLKSRVASRYAQGFAFPHLIHLSKENIINKIKIFLAGGIAEEMIFGEEKATISRSFDREEATSMIMEYIRKYGFDKNYQAYYAHSGPYSMDLSVTDWAIERMIRDLTIETKELLEKNQEFLVFLSKELAQKGSLKPLEVVKIAEQFGHTFEVKEENYLHLANYEGILNQS
ncbi:cell division protease FtsH [Arcicella aurantiaca]|uniref:Cell division protease FtsH n=1 Tax=Arcicella aurantiaca TaxID=591202 RepID=A0A316EHG3_9BACT|nr:AAA family ATPase [Arcicella aurantiaca]PWK29237.1 cell division protease FtsH [Arcicella aurantiaca]